MSQASRRDVSPFYTPAKPIPGQLEIPVATVHLCPACRSDYVCDVQRCEVAHASPCQNCGGEVHSQHPWNLGPLPDIERPPIIRHDTKRQPGLFDAAMRAARSKAWTPSRSFLIDQWLDGKHDFVRRYLEAGKP